MTFARSCWRTSGLVFNFSNFKKRLFEIEKWKFLKHKANVTRKECNNSNGSFFVLGSPC